MGRAPAAVATEAEDAILYYIYDHIYNVVKEFLLLLTSFSLLSPLPGLLPTRSKLCMYTYVDVGNIKPLPTLANSPTTPRTIRLSRIRLVQTSPVGKVGYSTRAWSIFFMAVPGQGKIPRGQARYPQLKRGSKKSFLNVYVVKHREHPQPQRSKSRIASRDLGISRWRPIQD